MAKAENKLFSRDDVRQELYAVGCKIKEIRNSHLVASRADGRHNTATIQQCESCLRYEGELRGINAAIRHFGGRFQLAEKP